MQIDPETGKVYFENYTSPIIIYKLKQSFEEMKIKENMGIETGVEEEAIFQKTRHHGLPYGRLKYLLYCFLLMVDGLVGIMSFGQIQSIIAQKYLLSKWIMGDDEDGDR